MVLTLTTLSLMKFLRSIMYRYGSIAVVKTQWPSIVVAACCHAEVVVAARNDVAFVAGVVLLFFKDDMAVVGSGSLSLHPPPPCFSVLVSPPPPSVCSRAPSLRLSPHRPRRLQDLGRRVRKSPHRALHRSVTPPFPPPPASRSHPAEENGTDPISGESLTKEDLVDVKASECGVPRRPATR